MSGFNPVWSAASAQRLKAAIARFGRQEDVAKEAGLSRSALAAILNGSAVPRPANLEAICQVLGIEPDAIRDGDRAERIQLPSATKIADSLMHINEVDLAYGMGGTFIDDLSATEVVRPLPAEWVRQFTKAPAEQLFICRGIGDSMFPTLLDSDMLLVDTSQQRIKQSDRVWVLTIGEVGMVKRLRARADGNYTVLSDNEHVPDMEAVDGEMAVIGRVVAVIRKM